MVVAAPPSTSVARVSSCALWGLEAALVTVEVDVASGLPNFMVVGLPDAAVSEARERVRAAVRNSGFDLPLRRIVANLAPAERKKEGSGFDLAIALGVLRATGQLTADVEALCLGELALDGRVRPVRGVMPRVRGALGAGVTEVLCAHENAAEAAAAGAIAIGVGSLREAVAHISGQMRRAPTPLPPPAAMPRSAVDLADISGHETPKRALEIAAAGGHSLLLVGPPGTGKTLLARALPGILPPLDPDEAVVASAVPSVAGLVHPSRPVLPAPPLPRAAAAARYPARWPFLGEVTPCRGGRAGNPKAPCTGLPDAIERYHARLSGPLMDRIDLRVHVPRLAYEDLRDEGRETSAAVRSRVIAARERMRARLGGLGRANAELSVADVRRLFALHDAGGALAKEAMRSRRLSARGVHRVLRVARTVADLAASDRIRGEDLALALLLRGAAGAIPRPRRAA